jgi:hydroxypyruvate reductase
MQTTSGLKRCARDIFNYALQAVHPARLIRKKVSLEGTMLRVGKRRYDLDRYDRILVVGIGKASAPMAQALEKVLRKRITKGLVVVKYGHALPLKRIRVLEAGHPFPDRMSRVAAEELLDLVSGLNQRDLVFSLLSGGGSALLCLPPEGITLRDFVSLTRRLLSSGADIKEINTLRKHLSLIHGGRLARAMYPATLISLILSDVVGDPLDMISSGPTVPNGSTFRDALEVIGKHGLNKGLPRSVYSYLHKGVKGEVPENPKEGDHCFSSSYTVLLGNNNAALKAAGERARTLGFNTLILSSSITGEAREVANVFTSMAKEVCRSGRPIQRPACLLAGGETTVTLRGRGKGGRNQEFALASALELAGWDGVVILSGGTDGTDGPTDVAGAVVDGYTCKRAEKRFKIDAKDYLQKNNSYSFFRRSGGHLVTGPTLTNVMDIMLALVGG